MRRNPIRIDAISFFQRPNHDFGNGRREIKVECPPLRPFSAFGSESTTKGFHSQLVRVELAHAKQGREYN